MLSGSVPPAGEPCAQHWVGNALYDAGRTDAACTWWAAAASSGYPPSLLTLGELCVWRAIVGNHRTPSYTQTLTSLQAHTE